MTVQVCDRCGKQAATMVKMSLKIEWSDQQIPYCNDQELCKGCAEYIYRSVVAACAPYEKRGKRAKKDSPALLGASVGRE